MNNRNKQNKNFQKWKKNQRLNLKKMMIVNQEKNNKQKHIKNKIYYIDY